MNLEAIGSNLFGWKLLLASVGSVEDWPASRPELGSPNFVALVAMDASAVSDQTLSEFARKLLWQGMVYLCTWGPDCERVHDITDGLAELPPSEDDVVMTTWHWDDTLEDAVEFAGQTAWPTMVSSPAAARSWRSSSRATLGLMKYANT